VESEISILGGYFLNVHLETRLPTPWFRGVEIMQNVFVASCSAYISKMKTFLQTYYHMHTGPPLGSKNFKKIHEKILLNPPKSPEFSNVFAAT
jgi:hypothetical protein